MNDGNGEAFTVRTRALEAEITAFCKAHRLTPRESEVVGVLAEGVVRIKDIAERLDLSPNTVNNHVNSIFLKTKTRSKSQLLAMLLNRISEDLQWARIMRQCPRVLFVGRNATLAPLGRALDSGRFKISTCSSADLGRELIRFSPHFLIYDIGSRDVASIGAEIEKIRSLTGAKIVLLADAPAGDAYCRAMELGAIELLSPSSDASVFALLLLNHYIEDESDRWRFLDLNFAHDASVQAKNKVAEIKVILGKSNCGSGGLFMPWADLLALFKQPPSVGDWLEFPLAIDGGEPLKVKGHVAWVRSTPELGRAAGAGVRIMACDERLRAHLKGRSYIPIGGD